jgi:DNA-binding IclR family transcriptional regulator
VAKKNSENPFESRLFVQSFAKGMEVLRAFGLERPTMSLPEIATVVGVTKSAAQRFATTLHALGYLQKDIESKRYSLTPKVIELGYQYLVVDRFLERASPYALDLSRRCRETVNLAEGDGHDMVYLARFASQYHMPVYMPVGRRLPMYCTSAGRAYLAALPRDQAYKLLERSTRPRYTRTTVSDLSELMQLLEQAINVGYAFANGEYYEGDLGIAVAVRDVRGQPIGAINISCPSLRWTLGRMRRELAPLLIETARLISTTPPPSTKSVPFLLGAGAIAPTGNVTTVRVSGRKRRER